MSNNPLFSLIPNHQEEHCGKASPQQIQPELKKEEPSTTWQTKGRERGRCDQRLTKATTTFNDSSKDAHQDGGGGFEDNATPDQDGTKDDKQTKTQDVQNQYLLNLSFCNFTSAEYLTYPNWSLVIFFKQDWPNDQQLLDDFLFDQPLKVGQSRNQRTTIGGGQHSCWWRKLFITKSIQFWQRLQFIRLFKQINIPQLYWCRLISNLFWNLVACPVPSVQTYQYTPTQIIVEMKHCDRINSLIIFKKKWRVFWEKYEDMLRLNFEPYPRTDSKYTID